MILLHAFELVYSYFMVEYDEPPSLWFPGGYLHIVCASRWWNDRWGRNRGWRYSVEHDVIVVDIFYCSSLVYWDRANGLRFCRVKFNYRDTRGLHFIMFDFIILIFVLWLLYSIFFLDQICLITFVNVFRIHVTHSTNYTYCCETNNNMMCGAYWIKQLISGKLIKS
jgi:hypothetical protein